MYRDEANIRQLSERLRAVRKARGLTQEQVADLTGVSQSAISLYELGRREPYIITAKRLAIAYGVTLDWLMGITDVGGPEDDGEPVIRIAITERGRDVVADIGELMGGEDGGDGSTTDGVGRGLALGPSAGIHSDGPEADDSFLSSGL